jgi:hypothetical protein
MTKRIEYLLKNSGLPGPRGNLTLLYSFSKDATAGEVAECLSFINDNLKNSPEEFAGMCGIVGLCCLQKDNPQKAIATVRPYASHSSWRIREAVAIGIQEMVDENLYDVIKILEDWTGGNEYEKRAVIASLCEPKLLVNKSDVKSILNILAKTMATFSGVNGALSEGQIALRKAAGYCWSVAIVASPEDGKKSFEKLLPAKNKHISWIIKENLKKNRLLKMDREWVVKIGEMV